MRHTCCPDATTPPRRPTSSTSPACTASTSSSGQARPRSLPKTFPTPSCSALALQDELGGAGGALGAVGEANTQRAVGLGAEHQDVLLSIRFGQSYALTATPEARFPRRTELVNRPLEPGINRGHHDKQEV